MGEVRSVRTGEGRSYLYGLVGQGLSFLAVLVPLAVSPTVAITTLVQTSAIAFVLTPFATLALPAVYPAIRDADEASTAMKAAGIAGLSTGVLLTAVGLAAHETLFGPYVVGAAPMTVLMSAEVAMTAWLVRRDNPAAVAANRFRYGLVSLIVTTLVAATSDAQWSLVVSSCAVYALAVGWSAMHHRSLLVDDLRAAARSSSRRAVAHGRRQLAQAAAFTASLGGGQLINAGTASYGSLAAPWAVATSICGGFGTVAVQFVVPGVDAAVAKTARTDDPPAALSGVVRGLVAGTFLATVAVGLSLSATLLLGHLDGVSGGHVLALVVAVALHWGTALVTWPISHTVALLGYRNWSSTWSGLRLACLVVIFVGTTGTDRLVALAAASAAFSAAFLALALVVIRATRRRVADQQA